AAAVVIRTGLASGFAAGSFRSMTSTVGAPFRWVTPSDSISAQIRAGSTFGRQTCVPPTAVTAHGKHQPLQWNIGSVQRKTEPGPSPLWHITARHCRYAPRWLYITPLARPVVPLV